ncbi:MAG: hypothetical protein RL375_695 [Pseudomonadota bacterium]
MSSGHTAWRQAGRIDNAWMALRILIVDDEAAIRFAVSEYFIAYGETIDSAADTLSAGELLARHAYDAVIADLRLGGNEEFGGLEVIDLAARSPSQPCIVLLSAEHSPDLVGEAVRRGAHHTLHKPLPLHVLKACINDFRARRALAGPDGSPLPCQPSGPTDGR